jgi:hypothetical protein
MAINVRLIGPDSNDFGHRWISVASLRHLLATLPDDYNLVVSPIGMLVLYANGSADAPGDGVGWIEIGREEVVL